MRTRPTRTRGARHGSRRSASGRSTSKARPTTPRRWREGVRRLLEAPTRRPFLDRATKEVRPVRAERRRGPRRDERMGRSPRRGPPRTRRPRGDRACGALRDAGRHTRRCRAAVVARSRGDALAARVIEALTGWAGLGPDAWLADRLRESQRERARKRAIDEGRAVDCASERLEGALDALRARLTMLSPRRRRSTRRSRRSTPSISAPDGQIPRSASRTSTRCAPPRRTTRRDARQEREAATVAGMLRYFEDPAHRRRSSGDEILAVGRSARTRGRRGRRGLHVPQGEGARVAGRRARQPRSRRAPRRLRGCARIPRRHLRPRAAAREPIDPLLAMAARRHAEGAARRRGRRVAGGTPGVAARGQGARALALRRFHPRARSPRACRARVQAAPQDRVARCALLRRWRAARRASRDGRRRHGRADDASGSAATM